MSETATAGGPGEAPPRAAAPPDERVAAGSALARALGRPELGALLGAVALFAFFAVVAPEFVRVEKIATILYAAATMGIMVVGVSLLMIGGEFDLSAGVMVTTASLTASLVSYQFTLNVWAGVGVSLAVSLALGFLNGVLYVRTGLPSFVVTLGTFFMLAGANLGMTKWLTGDVATPSIADIDGFAAAKTVFAGEVPIASPGGDGPAFHLSVTVLWWALFVALATVLLLRTRAGNWIFAAGGAAPSARAVGVPVVRTKIALFMGVALMAWFSGMHLLFAFDSVQSGEGVGNEFFYIICAVVGGCLLTGGYGSAVGAAVGALIFGLTNKGIVYAEWDPNWFKFFLGAMLLIATIVNVVVRRRVEAAR